MKAKKKPRFLTRIFIMIRDKSKPIKIDNYGRKYAPVMWKETGKVSLGSLNNPNKNILRIKIETMPVEEDLK
jgi:hypothetical protein